MSQQNLFDDNANQYDALLIVSFGGPEGLDDVIPFLDNVLRGLKLPEPARARIAKRYEAFGGVSPINMHTRKLIAALRTELDAQGPELPIYWGNRNWHPLLADTMRQMMADGVKRVITFVTSNFSSYSGCRKYREDLYEAMHGLENPPHIDKLRLGYNHPGFIKAFSECVQDALKKIPEKGRKKSLVLFTAHSLPESMAHQTNYQKQLKESCQLIGDVLDHQHWRLVYQSNNASYGKEAWLGPDVCDALAEAKKENVRDVVVAPIGFVCDHLEVLLDLDTEARQRAQEIDLNMVRASTVGTHPDFVRMIRDLIYERMMEKPLRPALGPSGPSHDYCSTDCCLSGRPGEPKPALCGTSV